MGACIIKGTYDQDFKFLTPVQKKKKKFSQSVRTIVNCNPAIDNCSNYSSRYHDPTITALVTALKYCI